MKFWKKYKAKKELKKKQFVNFYGYQIDLSLGGIKCSGYYSNTITTVGDFYDDSITTYQILLRYDNFLEQNLSYEHGVTRDDRYKELVKFIVSNKFTELLDQYENLKKEYEQL